MQQELEKKMLTRAEYEQLIRQGCIHPKAPAPDETVEDAYWWSICREVYRYLNIEFFFLPIEGATRGEVYRTNLHRVVNARQSEHYHSLAIANEYITEALGKRNA